MKDCILTINGGSSSIKFALYKSQERLLHGEIERIGIAGTTLSWNKTERINIAAKDLTAAAEYLRTWLEKQDDFPAVKAIGHRVVYGLQHTKAERITPQLLGELKKSSLLDPEHMPGEIKLIEVFMKLNLPQIACFDTSFHAGMPAIAKLLPIPKKYNLQRYGFHGLSYAYLMQELDKDAGDKTILAHLGNGASLAAIKEGKSVDTTMGFTPTSGLPMSTRTGDLDPGVAWYLMNKEELTPKQFNHLINHESGLLGISGISPDMRELSKHTEGKEAIAFFCYQTRKWIGAYAAVLGGLDTLVFAGGIGENAAAVREMICENLEFLGIKLDKDKNENNERLISTGKTNVYVIHTNEELMIAKMVSDFSFED
ncbi:acetate/propionate family kinase [Chitinophaga oryziterrae]|uniref:Acetate kinase n=1 Tax=Chitinophaga oryziterrae TaxID=1031224 RepID=A0A6N8J6W5_9BACT|nr:acetate/propionate family kinase [Chitinophaga oryziterrae]MVT40338.1 acetate/propionate family kinase [Chitinophaga oryziterrae]